jgi:hypothetical protein
MSQEAYAKQGQFHGEDAIWLSAGAYEAAALPQRSFSPNKGTKLATFAARYRE